MRAKILIALLLILAYFLVWRPVRVAATRYVVKPLCEEVLRDNPQPVIEDLDGGITFQIVWETDKEFSRLDYRPPFGIFFLMALVAMIFITTDKKYYLRLFLLHAAAFLLALATLIAGIQGIPPGFLLSGIIIYFITPALTLAYIPWLLFSGKAEELATE